MTSSLAVRRLSISPRLPLGPMDRHIRYARDAEAAGFEGVSLGEGSSSADPFQMLAVIAQETKTLEIATAVATWTRTPPVMAASVTTLDVISGGRFSFGIGTMPKAWNESWHGIEASRPIARMREYIEVLRLIWSSKGRKVSYDGSFFQLDNFSSASLGRSSELDGRGIPVYLAVTMPQMSRLGGEIADGVFLHNIHTIRYLREVTIPAIKKGAGQAGRSLQDIDVVASILCSISNDRREAVHWVKTAIASHLVHPYVHAAFDLVGLQKERSAALEKMNAGDVEGAVDAIPDDLVYQVGLVGTPDECRSQLSEYVDLCDAVRLCSVTRHVPKEWVAENEQRMLETFALK